MGRVRRYKKYKAIDPFAKGHRAETDLVHDEPPSVHEDKGIWSANVAYIYYEYANQCVYGFPERIFQAEGSVAALTALTRTRSCAGKGTVCSERRR